MFSTKSNFLYLEPTPSPIYLTVVDDPLGKLPPLLVMFLPMKKFLVRVTESINHDYEIEAETEEDALSIYYSYDNDQLKALDLDGQSEWDSHPWEVEETE